MPATQPKSGQQPKDPYTQRGKALASQVQRLRGWMSTDAARLPELVDTLNALVAHRLDGHAYAAAGPDAQDAVKQSAKLLLASGPIGPYSSATDAVRCGTALVQLAALQAGIGLTEAAGGTLDSWAGLREQVVEAGTSVELGPDAGRHALAVAARVALAGNDAAVANAYADAALGVQGTGPDDGGFGQVDIDRLVSDARWAAGFTEQSLGFLHTAKETYESLVGGRLAEPGRLSAALAERLGEPLPGLYRDLADRLGAVGELDLALANRRLLVERLRALASRSETFRLPLASALTDLATDLVRAGRAEEALDAAHDAESAAAHRALPGSVRLLAGAALARASIRADRHASAAPLRGLLSTEGEAAGTDVASFVSVVLAETLRAEGLEEAAAAVDTSGGTDVRVLEDRARAVVSRGDGSVSWEALDPARAFGAPLAGVGGAGSASVPTWLEQERAEARRQEADRADEARREAEERAAQEASAREAEQAAAAARTAAEAERRAQAEAAQAALAEAEQAERKRRREERLREHQAEVDAREREQRAARVAEIDDRLVGLDAAQEQERDRLLAERKGLVEVGAAEVEPVAEPEPLVEVESVVEVEPVVEVESVVEVEPVVAPVPEPVEEPEPEPEPEPVAETEPEAEPAEPDDLAVAEGALGEARERGGRREVRAAAEAVVAVLRGRYAQEPDAYENRLRAALEDLSSARLRSGDLFGARAASREAKTLR